MKGDEKERNGSEDKWIEGMGSGGETVAKESGGKETKVREGVRREGDGSAS